MARPVLQTPDDEGYPVLSPDGRWLAYSVRTGDTAVAYIQSFPEPGGRVRVSSVNGNRLGWTPKGDGLLTAGEGQVFITAIDGSGPKVVAGRTEVFSTQATGGTTPVGALYVHPTTGRLLATLPAGNAQARPVSTSAQLIVNAAALFDGGRQ